jgi:hypothetical protein
MKKILILLLVVTFAAITVIYFITPSREYKELEYGSGAVIYEGALVSAGALLLNDNALYLSCDFIREYIDDDIFCDYDYGLVTILYENELIRIDDDLIFQDGQVYIPVETITGIYPVDVYPVDAYPPSTEKADAAVNIRDRRNDIRYASANDDVYIRYEQSIKSSYMEILEPGETVYVLDESEDWLKIWSGSGSIGYALSKEMSPVSIKKAEAVVSERPAVILSDKRIFAWEMMYEEPDDTEIYTGIDIISPTWGQLKNAGGDIIDRVSAAYAEELLASGSYIFPCITNDFNDTDMTSGFLEDPYARSAFISGLIDMCRTYGFQGLNIDFENIDLGSRAYFTQFIRELSYYTHKEGLVLSVCTGVANGSANYSLCYDHRRIGEFADYIMLMTYDELMASGDTYGPVASLDWVSGKLAEILEMVRPEKIYLGMPLYTRVWNIDVENSYTSIAVSIRRQEEILAENMDGIYDTDPETGYTIFKYTKEGTNYILYIEDLDIIGKRFDIINVNKLAGAAFWAKNYVDAEIFDEILTFR